MGFLWQRKARRKEDNTTITIPTPLFEKIQERSRTQASLQSPITYNILRETGSEVAVKKTSKNESATIIEKLKASAYTHNCCSNQGLMRNQKKQQHANNPSTDAAHKI